MEGEVQDLDAWIKIARSNKLLDKIARIQFSIQFKSSEDYAKYLELLKVQKLEDINLFKKHVKERELFKGMK